MKEAMGPGVAKVATPDFVESGDFMVASFLKGRGFYRLRAVMLP
jgi:hypothetical protein